MEGRPTTERPPLAQAAGGLTHGGYSQNPLTSGDSRLFKAWHNLSTQPGTDVSQARDAFERLVKPRNALRCVSPLHETVTGFLKETKTNLDDTAAALATAAQHYAGTDQSASDELHRRARLDPALDGKL